MATKKENLKAKELVINSAKLAFERHCTDIMAIDLTGISPATDYFLIATGTSERQMRSIADEIIFEAKHSGHALFGKAGYEQGSWVVLDFVDVVVHIFSEESRVFYDLELLWGDAPKVDLEGVLQNAISSSDSE